MTKSSAPASRAGRINELRVTLDRVVLAARRNARAHYGGDLSPAIAEGGRLSEEQAGREELALWLGPAGETTAAERKAIRAEWRGPRAAGERPRQRAGRRSP